MAGWFRMTIGNPARRHEQHLSVVVSEAGDLRIGPVGHETISSARSRPAGGRGLVDAVELSIALSGDGGAYRFSKPVAQILSIAIPCQVHEDDETHVRSTSVAMAERPPFPIIKSPSQRSQPICAVP